MNPVLTPHGELSIHHWDHLLDIISRLISKGLLAESALPTPSPGPRASSNMCLPSDVLCAHYCGCINAEDSARPGCEQLKSQLLPPPCSALPCAVLRVSPFHFSFLTPTRTQSCCVCGRSCLHREHLVETVPSKRIGSSWEQSDSPGSFYFFQGKNRRSVCNVVDVPVCQVRSDFYFLFLMNI
ncbi:hypothetical protein NQZ68_037787 [Dissostichus eleginoides]|nr:hypothetical protein NQZ68_037787 [Dissostichus eleginoides]